MHPFINKYKKEILVAFWFLFTYTPTIMWMWDRRFVKDSYYTHGFLIPFITGFLIWLRWEDLRKTPQKRSRWGVPLIVSGMVIHVISSFFRVYFSSALSMLIVLSGLILYFYGKKIYHKVLFPVLFLFFMMPAPLIVITNISFKMKILAAEIAREVLTNMGFVALREGSIIKMQHVYVVVDDICSGLRSLISLTALGSLFAYWMDAPLWKRAIVFASTVPIAIITNVLRIILLSVIAEIWGPQYTLGFIHDLSGFLVFGFAFILLFVVGRLVE